MKKYVTVALIVLFSTVALANPDAPSYAFRATVTEQRAYKSLNDEYVQFVEDARVRLRLPINAKLFWDAKSSQWISDVSDVHS